MAKFCFFSLIGVVLFVSCGFYSVNSASTSKAAEHSVFCYFGSWATYRWGIAQFDVTDINAALCTHVIYAYSGLTNGVLSSLDPYNDFEENYGKGTIKKFINHATNTGFKPLLGVGGYNEGSVKYSQMASTAAGREAFANSAVTFLNKYGFQGLQLDWQYPTMMGGAPQDKANYLLLLQSLSEKFEAQGLSLSVGVSGSPAVANSAYEFAEVAKYVEHIVILSFDYHTASDGVTGIAAPLESEDELSVDYSVKLWLNGGAPASKVIIGVPMYGRTDHLLDANQHGLGDRNTGPGTAGQFTQEAGLLAYFEYCTNPSWIPIHSDAPSYTYAYHDFEWINYDDADTISTKADYVLEQGLGGIMVFSLESEDFGGNCGAAYPLLTAANKALGRLS